MLRCRSPLSLKTVAPSASGVCSGAEGPGAVGADGRPAICCNYANDQVLVDEAEGEEHLKSVCQHAGHTSLMHWHIDGMQDG